MHKIFKHITWVLTVAVTLITCSGCFEKTAGDAVEPAPVVTLTTSPANVTYREMSEELYIGYLGAQRDFALLVDNLQYNYDNNKGGCQTNDSVGCASAMGQLLIQHGLKETHFTGKSSDKNVLVYYTSATAFKDFGGAADGWLSYLAPSVGSSEHSDFNRSENVIKNSCGTGSDSDICKYARDIAAYGHSSVVGNAMILLFANGDYAGMISDKMLDPNGNLNTADDHDNVIKGSISYDEYQSAMVKAIKNKINVASTTADSTVKATKRSLTQINTLDDLKSLVEGKGIYAGIEDYLLLITSEGFLEEKIGNNYAYETAADALNGSGPTPENQGLDGALNNAINNIMLLFNTASSYNDNCAVESDEFMNFLKAALETLLSVGAGAAIGAAVGTMIFPGIGTAVGAVIGGIIGFFANDVIGDMLNDANGITGDKYCKIMTAALNDFEVNVPMYSYKISSFGDYKGMEDGTVDGNLTKYKNGTMDPLLKEYYDANQVQCLTQNVKIGVASGLASILVGNLAQEYNYADKCEASLVRSIVGGFYGSPSLLLFVNRNKVDDLHGRATTALIRETIFTWGLTQIGNIYNLAVNNSMAGIKVTVGAAQPISGFRYCTSTSETPSCAGLDESYISTNGTYVGALKAENGIEIDLTSAYRDASNDIINSNSGDYKFTVPSLASYSKNTSGSWSRVYTNPESIGENLPIADLKSKISSKFSEKMDSWYAVNYGGKTFLICNDAIIGYSSEKVESGGELVVEYYWDGTTEYIFKDGWMTSDNANSAYITRDNMQNPGSVKISGAHKGIYIYMPYTAADGSENVYTYIV